MAAGVYAITNRNTGKQYIGSTKSLDKRWLAHRSCLKKGNHLNKALQTDWTAAPDEFEFVVLEETNDLTIRENFYFETLHPAYNLTGWASRPDGERKVKPKQTWIYIANRKLSTVEYRQRVNRIAVASRAPFAGYDVDDDAVFDASDPVERLIIERESCAAGLTVWELSGAGRPTIVDKRD